MVQVSAESGPESGPSRIEIDRLVTLFSENRLAEAEAVARQMVQIWPNHGTGWKALGAALAAQRRMAEALPIIQKAVVLLQSDAEAHNNLGIVLTDLCRLSEAEASYRRAVELEPDHSEAHSNLGNVLRVIGRPEEAMRCHQRGLEIKPDDPTGHNSLGNALREIGQLDDAVESYRRALAVNPDYAGAHTNLGNTLHELGQTDEAVRYYRRALDLNPDLHEAHHNLGNVLDQLGRLDEAVDCYQRVLELKPELHEVHNKLGGALHRLERLDDAERCYRRVLELKPDFHEAHNNLGNVLGDLGKRDEAVASYERALAIKPDFAIACNNLGNALQALGRSIEAETGYRRALELKPDYHEAYTNLLFCLSHNKNVGAQALFAEHHRFGELFETPLRASWPQHTNARDAERMLQIGIVSGDLVNHSVAFFIEPLLAQLAGYPQMSLHAYSNCVVEDHVSRRLRGHFSHWHRIASLSDAALAEGIRDDGIDILIDLSGHTAKHRLLTFARKPAPVQASWMGYPGTTGLSAMDYYLADRFFLPPGEFDGQFTEKVVRVPAYLTFLPRETAPTVNPLPALSNGFVTFGSFNRPSKLCRPVITLWSRLLRALPDARMVLGAMPSNGNNDWLMEWFAREGIAPERLRFYPRCRMDAYLRLHQRVDLCLDTLPYTGGTTTLHALWMGVPTLTLAGHTAPGRVSAGTLGHFGLEAFVALDAADFVRKGISWAGDVSGLAALRAGLRGRFEHSLVGQPAAVAAGVERALRIMWRRWCAGLPAESFEVRL